MITAEQARQIQDLHTAFVRRQSAKGVDGPVPPGRKEGSDYNQHFSILESSGADWDEYDRKVREILGLPQLEPVSAEPPVSDVGVEPAAPPVEDASPRRAPLKRSKGSDPEDIERRRPYPGQQYKHGWIKVGPFEQWHGDDLGDLQELADAVESGETGRFKLSGGTMGDVFLVDHGNGAETIEKRMGDVSSVMGPDFPPELQADAEQAAATLGRAIEAPVPRTLRTAPDKVTMDVIYGDTWFELEHEALGTGDDQDKATAAALLDSLTGTNEGVRLGVFDLLIDNWDRTNGRNWKVDDDTHRPVGYDHAFAWSEAKGYDPAEPPQGWALSPFSTSFVTRPTAKQRLWSVGGTKPPLQWIDNPLTPDDVAFLRERLAAVEDDFTRLGRHDWWEFASARLEAIAQHATGTESIFA